MTGRSVVFALFVAIVVTAPARRSDGQPSQEELARSHFVAGEQEYARGRWREALHEFEAGYALSPRPEFLINFAQVHRKLGDYDAAERECRQYLATAPPPQLASQAQRLLGQIEDERAHAPSQRSAAPVAPTPSPVTLAPPPLTSAPPSLTSAPPPVTPAPSATAPLPVESRPLTIQAPPPRKKRVWIAPVVVGGALVIAGAITLGLVLGLPPHDTFKAAPLGTVDFR